MAATIKIKNSSTTGAVPTSSDLVQGELAVNVTDKRIFTENASGTVVELGTNPTILTLPDGSASAPTLTNDGDTNTGIFFPAADTFGISTGGSERLRLDASGNLGVGITSPSSRLDVRGSNNATNFRFGDSTGANALNIYNNTTSGVVDLGTSASAMAFSNAGVERARIDSSGNLLVGTTSFAYTAAGVSIKNQVNIGSAGTGGSTLMNFGNGNGAVGSITVTGSTTAYNTSSDYRLKDITGGLTGYKERLSALQPKQGSWKADGSEFRGFLAHEFAESYPSSVNGEKDAVDEQGNPKYQGMQAGSTEVIADLVAYIKELETRLSALEQA